MIEKYLNKITCGDSYKLIKELPDKSVDLIVTDPPYLLETEGSKENKRCTKVTLNYDKYHGQTAVQAGRQQI